MVGGGVFLYAWSATTINCTSMYTTIIHPLRKQFGLTVSEYCVLDSVYFLSHFEKYDNWCVASSEKIAKELDYSGRTVLRALDRLEELGFIKRRKTTPSDTAVKTTDRWNAVIAHKDYMLSLKTSGMDDAPDVEKIPPDKMSCPPRQNVRSTPDKMSYNTNNNTNKNIIKKDFSKKEGGNSYKNGSWSKGSSTSPTPPPRSQPVPETPKYIQELITAPGKKNPKAWYHDCKEWAEGIQKQLDELPEAKGILGGHGTPVVANIKLDFGRASIVSNFARQRLKESDLIAAAKKFITDYIQDNRDTPGNLQNKVICNVGSLIKYLPETFQEQFEQAKTNGSLVRA